MAFINEGGKNSHSKTIRAGSETFCKCLQRQQMRHKFFHTNCRENLLMAGERKTPHTRLHPPWMLLFPKWNAPNCQLEIIIFGALTFTQAITSSEWASPFFQMIHVLIWNRLYFDTECETMNTNQLAVYVPTVLSNRSKITGGADNNPHASSPLFFCYFLCSANAIATSHTVRLMIHVWD